MTLEALAPHHMTLLQEGSGISDEVIAARGYRTITLPRRLTEYGYAKVQAHQVPGLLIPLSTVTGLPAQAPDETYLTIYRPDHPRQGNKGKVLKYETPYGYQTLMDCHPAAARLVKEDTQVLWLTEGVKKGDALVSHGAAALAFPGVWNFLGKENLAQWDQIPLKGRQVNTCFDSDVTTKAAVKKALARLTEFLRLRGASPFVCLLPQRNGEKCGVDDFLAGGHTLADLDAFLRAPDDQGKYAPLPPERQWEAEILRVGMTQTPRTCLGNMQLLIEHHPWLKGNWWWDVLAQRPMREATPVVATHIDTLITGFHRLGMATHNRTMTTQALHAVCRKTPRNVLQDWCNALPPWDQTPRLDTYLSDYLGATNSPYTQWAGRMLLLAMISRAYEPGRLVRYALILEGAEQMGKSSFLRWLGGEFYQDLSCTLEGKEAHMLVKGRWLVELSELSALGKTGEARLKSFLTLLTESYVPKYENDPVDIPRSCVFVGTTNGESPLRGQTGNTRFIPVRCLGAWTPRPQTDRQQLVAEALHVWRALTVPWWQVPADVMTVWEDERELRRDTSVYEGKLSVWLAGWKTRSPGTLLTWEVIAEEFLQLEAREKWKDKSLQMQIAQALHALGWERGPRQRDPKTGVRVYPWVEVSPPF
jgi:hypothetical protein